MRRRESAQQLSGKAKTTMRHKQRLKSESRGRLWWSALLLALLCGVALLMGSGITSAQSDAPAAGREVTPDEVNTVAREIWCPLCSGVRLDACELKACEQMKEVIAIKLAEGEDTESIKAYFVEQYGPQVMGEPPRAGFNWLAWILPALAVVVGGYFFWRNTQRMMRPAVPLAANGETGVRPSTPARQTSATMNAAKADAAKLDEDDEYTQKLEEELAKYG
jgi:cytochrome c-type biogenesis protein CcmH